MYEQFDELIENGSLELPTVELAAIVKSITLEGGGSLHSLATWLNFYKYESGAEALYQAISQVYFSDSFEQFKVKYIALQSEEHKLALISSRAALCISYFARHDSSVDIARSVLGDTLFGVLEEAIFCEWRKLKMTILDGSDVDWISQEDLIEQYRLNTLEEFKESRYLDKLLEIQGEVAEWILSSNKDTEDGAS